MAKKKVEHTEKGSMNTTAWILILIGAFFFARNFIDISIGQLWPLILIIIGGAILIKGNK